MKGDAGTKAHDSYLDEVNQSLDMHHERISVSYSGVKGRAYSAWQLRTASGLGEENARRFRPYIFTAATVLDFGCGGGDIVARLPGRRRLGVEANEFSADSARAAGIEVFRTLDEVTTASVDVVISHHALEHCLRPADELRGMKRVLRSRGQLVLVLPVDDWRAQTNFRMPDLNNHLYTWTPLLISNLLKEVGFVVEQVRMVHHAWPPVGAKMLWAHLPTTAFDALAVLTSLVTRRRQLIAVARNGR